MLNVHIPDCSDSLRYPVRPESIRSKGIKELLVAYLIQARFRLHILLHVNVPSISFFPHDETQFPSLRVI